MTWEDKYRGKRRVTKTKNWSSVIVFCSQCRAGHRWYTCLFPNSECIFWLHKIRRPMPFEVIQIHSPKKHDWTIKNIISIKKWTHMNLKWLSQTTSVAKAFGLYILMIDSEGDDKNERNNKKQQHGTGFSGYNSYASIYLKISCCYCTINQLTTSVFKQFLFLFSNLTYHCSLNGKVLWNFVCQPGVAPPLSIVTSRLLLLGLPPSGAFCEKRLLFSTS